MRIHLFEFEDLTWFPDFIRQGITDFIRYFLNLMNFYHPVYKIISDVLDITKENQILDLCSGGGGVILQLQKKLSKNHSKDVNIILSDLYPNIDAFKHIQARSGGMIDYISFPVNAASASTEYKCLRTVFSASHHFEPQVLKSVLADAVRNNAPIGIFDCGDKNIITMFGMIFVQPLLSIFITPFIKPFKFSRLIYTYILPLIPLCTIWDGVVTILRLYSPEELLKIAKSVDSENYTWKAGKLRNRVGINVAYLVGWKGEGKS